MDKLVKMCIDVYKGQTGEFSKEQAHETLRKAFIEMNGGKDRIDYKSFRRNKNQIFEILEEAIAVLVNEGIDDQFSDWVEVRNLALGDTNVFTVEDTSLFKVATISDGNGNLRRQRLDTGEFAVATETKGIKIYEEFNRFLAGRIDWQKMVDKVAKSYTNEIATEIYDAIYDSYTNLGAVYGISGAYSETQLSNLIQNVEAATGANAVIYGTKNALGLVIPSVVSDNMKDKFNSLGYYGVFRGTEMREIKQAHTPGTDTFAINDSFLMIIPQVGDKFVKLVNEGEAIIQENPGGLSADMSLEYLFTMKAGIAVVKAAKYGIYRISG